METLSRILSGTPLNPDQLRAAGLFVIIWFVMDVIQFIDMVVGWLR